MLRLSIIIINSLLLVVEREFKMKKGLSILLVAAALFGFYGSAVSVNDILACKDYWEKAGEESTANMNKLEDGLNQLKENEQAYLDGKEQVADGEKALADGEAQYAQGLKDYEAAPGKLADARKQLAAGEEALAEGKKKLADGYAAYKAAPGQLAELQGSIKDLNTAKTSYEDLWKPGFEKKAEKPDYSDAGLQQGRQVITKTLKDQENEVKLIEKVSGKSGLLDAVNKAKTYAQFDTALEDVVDAFGSAEETLKGFADMATQYSENADLIALKDGCNSKEEVPVGETKVQVKDLTLAQTKQVIKGMENQIDQVKEQKKDLESQKSTLEKLPADTVIDANGTKAGEALVTINAGITKCKTVIGQLEGGVEKLSSLVGGRASAQSQIGQFASSAGDKLQMVAALSPELAQALQGSLNVIAQNDDSTKNSDFGAAIATLQGSLAKLAEVLNEKVEMIKTSKASMVAWDAGYDQLKEGKDTLANGLAAGFKGALNNKTVGPVLREKAPQLAQMLSAYSSKLPNDDLDVFNNDMKTVAGTVIPGLIKVLNGIKEEGIKSYNAAPAQLAQGEKDLAAGKAKLADGYRQYNQGLADYAAAPGKLEDAERQLAEGRQALADGKAQLAQYEDGEQQIRDGLATLAGTEADLDLQSIYDRLGGDDDFDNGDNHLEIDEGLAAVEIGRGYQAEDGVLITKEIMARAVATGGLLAAGVLAVLAAILSFLKKNKGAGVLAILAAAAGAFGAFYGTQAGTYFSSIAGSTVGATGWIAAGILGAVALVHAIVHFTAKPQV